jgi:hypothetical protein
MDPESLTRYVLRISDRFCLVRLPALSFAVTVTSTRAFL